MRARVLTGFALVLLFSFAGRAMAAEPWMDLGVKECKQAPATGSQAVGNTDPLASAAPAVTYCNTVADCRCAAPACACMFTHVCICNPSLCCLDPECP